MACSDEPLTQTHALEADGATRWQEAMDKEYDSIVENGSWKITDLPQGPSRSIVKLLALLKDTKQDWSQRLTTRRKNRLTGGILYNRQTRIYQIIIGCRG